MVLFRSISVIFLAFATTLAHASGLPLERLTLPPGTSIDVYTQAPGARSIAIAEPLDVAFIGTRGDTIYAVSLSAPQNRAQPVLTGLNGANGVVWHDGYLYVGEQHRIVRYKAPSVGSLRTAVPEVLNANLPDDSWHGWRYMKVGPDGMLYVAVGTPCNVCMPDDWEGTILRLPLDGSRPPEVFAHGIRNSVGLAFHPVSGDLYFTDNGADNMGDDTPADELNRATRAGGNYGYPYYGGGDSRTWQYRLFPLPDGLIAPIHGFQAHVAPLGLHVFDGDILVAQHGSWNRSEPVGYRVVRVHLDENGNASHMTPFIEGWLGADGKAWGRPVDVEQHPDGSLLISDDGADVVYRLRYDTPATTPKTTP